MTKCLLFAALLIPVIASAQGMGGMDLPVSPVKFGDKTDIVVIEPETGDGDDGDDPRDTPPPVIYGEELDSENDTIYYVIDRSCSMMWDWGSFINLEGAVSVGTRWDRAKAELTKSISGLSDNFEFNVIAYNCSTITWAPDLREANDPNKKAAIAWVHSIFPAGATGTGPSIAQALGDRDNMMVVLLTDGVPNCGADGTDGHRAMIRNNNIQKATINVFGISAAGSYRAFCQGVAADSGGSYFDVP